MDFISLAHAHAHGEPSLGPFPLQASGFPELCSGHRPRLAQATEVAVFQSAECALVGAAAELYVPHPSAETLKALQGSLVKFRIHPAGI